MKLERVRYAAHPLYGAALDLYKISFPPHEQREERSQITILQNDAYHFTLALTDEGEFVGEVLYWELNGTRYIEHFCILPEKRNHQYGQQVLHMLQDRPLILEIDPPVDAVSIRRRGFYERCGFAANPYKHLHPPYHRGNSGHDLVVMSSPAALTLAEYTAFADSLRDIVMKDAY